MECLRKVAYFLSGRYPPGVEESYLREVLPAVVILAAAFAILLCQRWL